MAASLCGPSFTLIDHIVIRSVGYNWVAVVVCSVARMPCASTKSHGSLHQLLLVPIHVWRVTIDLKNARAIRSSTDDENHWNFESDEENLEKVKIELCNEKKYFMKYIKYVVLIWKRLETNFRNELENCTENALGI